MSEESKEHTQVLLPGAQVALFTKNQDTIDVFMSLSDDWRFARVELHAVQGDVSTAIENYQSIESPDLIIVETGDIDDAFTEKLVDLAGNCSEGTSAIVIGPVNDVNLYRKLVGMGVGDYIVCPVQKEGLGTDIAAILLQQIGAKESRLIAMIGSKGGVGVSSLAQGLSWGLSETLEQKTFLMDTSAGWSGFPVAMGFEPATTLAEAARTAIAGDEDALARILTKPSERLFVLSSGLDKMLDGAVDPENLEALIDYVMAHYPVLVVDLSASSSGLRQKVLSRANQTIVVSTPTLSGLRAARSLMQEIKEFRGSTDDTTELVINMQGIASKAEVKESDLEQVMEQKPAAVIPFEPQLFLGAESQAKRLIDDKLGASIVSSLVSVVSKSVMPSSGDGEGANDDGKGGLGQFISKLKVKS